MNKYDKVWERIREYWRVSESMLKHDNMRESIIKYDEVWERIREYDIRW